MKKTILAILLLAFCVSISGAGITDKLRAVIAAKNTGGAPAGIALDRKSIAADIGTGTVTLSHTVGTGANRVLVVIAGTANYQHTITGVTAYKSSSPTAMTSVYAKAEDTHTGQAYVSGWIMTNPDSGTHDIVITASDGGAYVLGIASSWTGVDQSTPNRTATTGIANDTAITVTDSNVTSGDVVVDGWFTGVTQATLTEGANQTVLYAQAFSGSMAIASSYQDGADGGVMSWTISTAPWVTGAFSLIPAQ